MECRAKSLKSAENLCYYRTENKLNTYIQLARYVNQQRYLGGFRNKVAEARSKKEQEENSPKKVN